MLAKIVGFVGELLLTAGVLAALFAFYLLYWTGLETGKIQSEAKDNLRNAWAAPISASAQPADPAAVDAPGAPAASTDWTQGSAVALLSAPKAGVNELVAFEGVDQGVLAGGPGHYPGTALPGEVGNTAFAAHRDGHGAPFDNIDRLHTCDDITVETREAIYHYKVLPDDGLAGAGEAFDCVPDGIEVPQVQGQHIVTPDRSDVILPIGNAQMLTWTTCHPQWDNTHRLIIHAVLAQTEMKEAA
ncbi:class E sortase [Corynebacterium lactis]|uniref:Housekeeping sortase n=1 Tax=Corynebacterium lactis RW2-5 TaxID=1408189 RepID=A0A0K2GZ51_9CORY|nr:class E sortase [Corynebacterium lactis]ALA66958.1 housekeeping sortase [Corynebacterium lactis RW2-5]